MPFSYWFFSGSNHNVVCGQKEEADKLAKSGSRQPGQQSPVSYFAAKTIIKHQCNKLWTVSTKHHLMMRCLNSRVKNNPRSNDKVPQLSRQEQPTISGMHWSLPIARTSVLLRLITHPWLRMRNKHADSRSYPAALPSLPQNPSQTLATRSYTGTQTLGCKTWPPKDCIIYPDSRPCKLGIPEVTTVERRGRRGGGRRIRRRRINWFRMLNNWISS